MIVSFECVVSDKLRVAVDNYLNPRNPFLALTDSFFVENKAYYYKIKDDKSGKRLVLIVENGIFDLVAEYVALTGVMGFVFSVLSSGVFWSGILYVSIILVVISLCYLSSKFRFYLLRWRIHRVVDSKLELECLSKEQVINRFVFGVESD